MQLRQIIIVNAVNVALLIPVTILYFILGFPIWFIAIYAVWLIYMGIVNIYMFRSDSVRVQLDKADKHDLFSAQVKMLSDAADSIEFYRSIFEKYDESSSIRKTYDLLCRQSDRNIQKAVRWLINYNHISCPSADYINGLSESSIHIMQKLDELNELVIQVEDSETDVDLSYVNDFLKSLKEIIEDE